VTHAPDVAAVCERLREQGVDVIRVSYPDLIGVDRGRDVLLDELAAAAGHGLAFCRAVYHTSPMGDVVPVQGGLEAGLPDITVYPDLATLTPLPWEPNAAWCLGDAALPGGEPAPESPRAVARRVAEQVSGLGYTLVCGPELEFYMCEQAADGTWLRYANEPGNVYVVGRKGDPQSLLLHMLRRLREAGLLVTAANHEFSPGQFEINLGHSGLTDAADRSFRLKSAVQEIVRHRGLLATFMAKPFNDEGGPTRWRPG
jgi:glutamine synthetase